MKIDVTRDGFVKNGASDYHRDLFSNWDEQTLGCVDG